MSDPFDDIVSWLVDGTPGLSSAPAVIQELSVRLRAAGLPVDRMVAFVRTLHPHIVGRSFAWEPGGPVKVLENSWAFLQSPEFKASPIGEVFRTGQFARRLAQGPVPESERAYLQPWIDEGFTDFLAVPLRFMSGDVHAAAFGTKRPGGFGPSGIRALERVTSPLARVAEILALRRTAVNLLNTYVGRDAGERILSGKIQRGDVETINAVIWFSDLRGFTVMSGSAAPQDVIGALNGLFECQVPAIERHGGEVLKFIGDGLLGIFPFPGGGAEGATRCQQALEAAKEAFGAMETLNATRSGLKQEGLRFGLALHVGEVTYGNIGGASRLDFTCIGPAVNKAARLEGLTGKLEVPLVLSQEFVELGGAKVRALGEFELKGIGGTQPVYAPA